MRFGSLFGHGVVLLQEQGIDLSVHTREQLDAVAAELNSRPRKTLGWGNWAERLAELLATCV